MLEPTLRANLATLTALFSKHAGASAAKIGQSALNDNTFLPRVANGAGFSVRTYDRVVEWLSANWPAEVGWPENIDRPPPAPANVAAPEPREAAA
jgi:hypothetical protein